MTFQPKSFPPDITTVCFEKDRNVTERHKMQTVQQCYNKTDFLSCTYPEKFPKSRRKEMQNYSKYNQCFPQEPKVTKQEHIFFWMWRLTFVFICLHKSIYYSGTRGLPQSAPKQPFAHTGAYLHMPVCQWHTTTQTHISMGPSEKASLYYSS